MMLSRSMVPPIAPTLSWGITPGQSIGVDELVPLGKPGEFDEAYEYMDVSPEASMKGQKVDVAFIGSCTNSRISDLREVWLNMSKGIKCTMMFALSSSRGRWQLLGKQRKKGSIASFEDAKASSGESLDVRCVSQ